MRGYARRRYEGGVRVRGGVGLVVGVVVISILIVLCKLATLVASSCGRRGPPLGYGPLSPRGVPMFKAARILVDTYGCKK